MDLTIEPQPGDDERAAILRAFAKISQPPAGLDTWWVAGLDANLDSLPDRPDEDR